MKECKQCGRMLDESKYRSYKPRGKGVYKKPKPVSSSTICRDCEALNQRAAVFLKKIDEGKPYDGDALRKLQRYYNLLVANGRPPVTAAARRLIGLQPIDRTPTSRTVDELLDSFVTEDSIAEHIDKVKQRAYASFEQADAVHRRLTPQLKEAGMYEEVNNLMDDWYMDED